MANKCLRLTLKNDILEIGRMADELRAWGTSAGIPDNTLNELAIAMDDFVANIINHAFADKGLHHIEVNICKEPSAIKCSISDDGTPFNPLNVKNPDIERPVEQRKIGGLGIVLARSMVDETIYERKDGMNILSLRKDLCHSER